MHYDVVICTYNGEKYIKEQIESIVRQSLSPSKIIISDDGSSDKTKKILLKTFNQLNFSNYLFLYGPQRGVINNFFSALKHCDAPFTFLSDQDDIWLNDKVETYFLTINRSMIDANHPTLLFSDAILIDENGNVISNSFFRYQGLNKNSVLDCSIFYQNCVQGASIMMNKSLRELVLDSMKMINSDYIVMHDWWIAIIASFYGYAIPIDKQTMLYRQHQFNVIGATKKHNMIQKIINFKKTYRSLKQIVKQQILFENYEQSHFNLFKKSPTGTKHCGLFKFIVIKFFYFIYKIRGISIQ